MIKYSARFSNFEQTQRKQTKYNTTEISSITNKTIIKIINQKQIYKKFKTTKNAKGNGMK